MCSDILQIRQIWLIPISYCNFRLGYFRDVWDVYFRGHLREHAKSAKNNESCIEGGQRVRHANQDSVPEIIDVCDLKMVMLIIAWDDKNWTFQYIPYLTFTKYLTISIILPVAVTVEGVIGGEEDMCAIGNTERVEYLSKGYL